MLQRMKELSTQGANAALSEQQRGFIADEVTSLKDEINKVAERTTFNGISLLTGANQNAMEFQVGFNAAGDDIVLSGLNDVRVSGTNVSSIFTNLESSITSFSGGTHTVDEAQTLMDRVDYAINYISSQRANLGAQQNRLDHNINNLKAQSENLSDARSRVLDTDYAAETAQMTKTQIMQQAATAMLAQANQQPNVILSLLK